MLRSLTSRRPQKREASQMKTAVIRQFGDFDVFKYEDIPTSTPPDHKPGQPSYRRGCRAGQRSISGSIHTLCDTDRSPHPLARSTAHAGPPQVLPCPPRGEDIVLPTSGTIDGAPPIQTPSRAEHGLEGGFVLQAQGPSSRKSSS